MSPYVAQLPAGPELLVVLVVVLLLFGPLVLGVVVLLRSLGAGDEVAALEARVDELERQIDAADESGSAAGDDRRDGAERGGSSDAERRDSSDDDQ